MSRKNISKNTNGDGNPSSSQKAFPSNTDGSSKEKQGYVKSTLKTMYKNRFQKINERIDNVLTTISIIDRKVDEMNVSITSSNLAFYNNSS